MPKPKFEQENIKNLAFEEALGERYVAYAMSTIVSRSLPDVRDGLKPVHRRLLFAMRELKLNPESGFKKCARVVGDVIGKYHPHGDQAVYDAMVRLAQDFSVRYPLVDGQGNFGSIDGDNAAAMRYTEARLTNISELLLKDIENDTVDFVSTYDGEDKEPVVMPALFPNLLANGATGIAVGMATNIPSHNILELLKAIRHLVNNPNASIKSLLKYIKGPDFATGGTIISNKDDIKRAYETGKGFFRVRSRWRKEEKSHGQYIIIIDEIPWSVTKSRVLDRLLELIIMKKVPMLADIKDESTEVVRIVIYPKNKDVVPEKLMASLFNFSDLELRISLNMNVVDENQVPRVMNLKEVLQSFIEHRKKVTVRASKKRLVQIENRKEILEGYLVVFANLDEVIKIIREKKDPKKIIMKRWNMSDLQAESILNLRLRLLRKLEEEYINDEKNKITSEIRTLKKLISSDELLFRRIDTDMRDLYTYFSKIKNISKRRTVVDTIDQIENFPVEEFIEEEVVTYVLSKNNWMRLIKGNIDSIDEVKYKEGDQRKFLLKAKNTDKVIIASNLGRVFTIDLYKLSSVRGGYGEPIRLYIDLPSDQDTVFSSVYLESKKVLCISKNGKGFIISSMSDLLTFTKAGKTILKLKKDDELKKMLIIEEDHDHVALLSTNRKLLIIKLNDLPIQKRGKGVILQKIKNGFISDSISFDLSQGIICHTKSAKRSFKELNAWVGKRSQTGKIVPKGFPKSNVFNL